MDKRFKNDFPSLTDVADKKTSEYDERYNCIAWAFGDNARWWWPSKPSRSGQPKSFWPVPGVCEASLDAFDQLFSSLGWLPCSDGSIEKNAEKIVLYALNGKPTHAAKQLPDGNWSSKLGKEIDLHHDVADIEGPAYGVAVKYFSKRKDINHL